MNNLADIAMFLEFFGDAILVINEDSEIMFANKSCLQMFGYSKLEFENMTIDSLMSSESICNHKGKVKSYIQNGSHPKVMTSRRVMHCIDSKGNPFYAQISIASIDINGEHCGVAIIQDYSTIQSTIDDLKNEANKDSLTGLYNKRFLNDLLKKDYQGLLSSRIVGVVYFDLNGFKLINDKYGHDVGDFLLIEVSKRLNEELRSSDLFFRLGGDEFLVLFEMSNADNYRGELESLGFKINKVITEPVFIPKIKGSVTVGVSIGIGIYPYDNDNLSNLISMADKSMYESKSSGATFSLVSMC